MSNYTLVLPVHNEAESIVETLTEINEKIVQKFDTSILVCEDGSTDATKEVLSQLSKRMPMKLSLGSERKGYPLAAKEALLSTHSRYIVFMDSDGQYDPQDFLRLHEKSFEADIVMGRRTNRVEAWHRIVLSKSVKLIARLLFDVPYQDLTSAFRILEGDAARDLAKLVRYSKYNFWLEFTVRAHAGGYKIVEIPISYRARKNGSTQVYAPRKLPKIVWNEFYALFRTWWDIKFS